MPLIYITGAPGVGKTAILRELQTRGYAAHGTDEHGYSHWTSRVTGEVVPYPGDKDFDLHAWYKDHEWTLNPEAVAELRHEADISDKPIFLCGVAAGTEEVQHHFNQVVVLTADQDTLRQRITDRKDNNFGKTPHELKIVLEWQGKHLPDYRESGATIVDTAKPIEKVTDEVLEKTSMSS